MRTLKAVRNNIIGRFTFDQMVVCICWLLITMQPVKYALSVGITSVEGLLALVLAIGITVVYLIFFAKESTLYNSIRMIKYAFMFVSRDTDTRKYTCSTEVLKKRIPITDIHENGMIEFPGKQWGIMLLHHLPSKSQEQRAMYITMHEQLLNALPEGVIYKSMRFSAIDVETPGLEQVKDAINRPSTTKEMKAHLYATHDELSQLKGDIIWNAWGFIGVGKYKNASSAYDKSAVVAEIIQKSLHDAGISSYRMVDTVEISLVYSQLLSMRRVF
jgi:hypothetical protein